MNKFVPVLCIVGGGILSLIGAFYTIGLFPQLATAGHFAVDVLGFLLLGLGPLGLGLASLWYGRSRLAQSKRTRQAHHEAELTRQMLQLAQAHPQGITVQEGATQTTFSTQEVEDTLKRLYLDGKLDLQVTDQGQLVYKYQNV